VTGIVDFAVRQWRMTMAFLIFAVVGGILSMFTIALDAEPDVAVPFVTVQVVLPGVSPEDSERLIVKPLETELKSLEQLKQMDGTGYTSTGVIVLEFDADFDQDTAVDDVLEAVNKARGELPEDAKEPIVEEINTSTLPIIVVNIFGTAPDRDLQNRAKELRSALESNPQILEAVIQGERIDLLEAVIDPALMESYGLTFNELAAAIARNNSLITAGAMETESGKFSVKMPGLIEDAQDLADIVVRTSPDGSIVKMSDIAQVRRTYKDKTAYAHFQGRPSVSIEVSKRNGENIIEVVAEIRKIVAEETKDWPSSVQVELSQDQTDFIVEMIKSLTSAIINAIVLVAIVCIAALGLRSALMVGFAIPASFLMTIFMFNVFGATINMMVMFGMVLSVGILVDSAIVIIEYGDRKLAEGLDRKEAYLLAGKRMFWPIITSTATTLAAFLPLLFWNTLTGQFMSYFPKTLIYVLTASMLMALIFLPTIGALFGPRKVNARESLKALSGAEGDPMAIDGFTGTYARTIDKLARWPLTVLAVMIAFTMLIMVWFSNTDHNVEFFTAEGGDEIFVFTRGKGNGTVTNQNEMAKFVESRLEGLDGVQSMFTIAGAGASSGNSGTRGVNAPVDTIGRTFLELKPFKDRQSSEEIEADIIKRLENAHGVITEVQVVSNGPPIGKDITIEFTSDNLENLAKVTKQTTAYFQQNPGLVGIENTLPLAGIEWQLDIDRAEVGRLGLDVDTIGAAVQFVTEGSLVGFYRPLDSDEEVDIRIRFPKEERDIAKLDGLRIQTREGALPLSAMVKRIPKPRLDSIARRNQQRVYEIRANTRKAIDPDTGLDYATNLIVADARKWIAEEANLPADVNYKFLGQDEENKEAGQFFMKAGISTLFMMGVILLWQFNSFWHVVLTLSAVVFSVAGVLLGLQFYSYISIILVGTGVLALAGIVVNNNIVLIDTYQRLLLEGYESHEAAVRTAAQRMRPVFLTTVTTIVGLMPMVLAIHADLFTGVLNTRGTDTSSIWAPISYVIVCGLGFSTLLTLILTPVLLAAPAHWMKNLRKWFGRDKRNISDAIVSAE